jgi:hypothetical protein
MSGQPDRVREYVDALLPAVDKAVDLTLDFTPDTLPFLDHYRRHFLTTVGTKDGKRDGWRPEFLQLVAPMVGCYFAEVVRRRHDARWILPTAEVSSWRMEFRRCFLFFNPLGMAVESFLEREVEGVPGAFQVAREDREPLARLLDSQAPVLERDFYSLTVRWETLDLISTHLLQDRTLRGDTLDVITREAYEAQIYADEQDE